TPGGQLHGSGELAEGQVVGSADLEGLAAGCRVGDRSLHESGDIDDRNEVDGVLAAAEDQGTAGAGGGLLEQLDPQLEEGGGPHDRGAEAAGDGVLLGGVFHAEQLHGALRGSADSRHQDEVGAGGPRGVDEVGVAVAIDRRGRDPPWSDEAVHRRYHDIDPSGGMAEPVGVAYVAGDDLNLVTGEMRGPLRVTGEDANVEAPPDQATDDKGSESPGAASDEDHEWPPETWRRTASSTPPPPSWTGSR